MPWGEQRAVWTVTLSDCLRWLVESLELFVSLKVVLFPFAKF
jgi:hypothetical protein